MGNLLRTLFQSRQKKHDIAVKFFSADSPIEKVLIHFLRLFGWKHPLRGHCSLAEDGVAQIKLGRATLIKSPVVVELHDRASCQINGVGLLAVAWFGKHC